MTNRLAWARIAAVTRLAIGVTGDVGCGKSTVLEWLAARGAATLDADRVVHRLLGEDRAVMAAVAERFGSSLVTSAGIDRAALAGRVFADAAALADLEAIVHPAVVAAVAAWRAGVTVDVAVVEAVKLVESGMHAGFDRVWLVTCDRAVRRARLVAGRWSPEETDRRMASSAPLAPRLAAANRVIDNSGAPAATRVQLERAWAEVLRSDERGGGTG